MLLYRAANYDATEKRQIWHLSGRRFTSFRAGLSLFRQQQAEGFGAEALGHRLATLHTERFCDLAGGDKLLRG
jgi:hypothetical protein